VQALSERLNQQGEYKCYLGMRHWSPWIEETVRDMLADGVTRAISLVMAPHYSRMSVGQYHARVAAALEMYRGHIEFEHIQGYHDAPGYIQALTKRVREGLSRWSEREAVHTVFSAHSLPASILATGDPYDSQARETARLVAQNAGLAEGQWSWSYQSASRSREPWLGPPIEEHLANLAQQGARNILSVPVGFVSDHVETLHDLDIRAKQVAQDHGLRFERPPALNDEPLFIAALAELIHKRAISTQMNTGP
jgi:ferrochelatase